MLEKIKLQEFESFKLFSYGWTNIEIQTVRTDSHSSSLKAVCHSSVIKGWWFEACNTLILCGLFSRPAVMYNAVPDSGCEKNWDDITNLTNTRPQPWTRRAYQTSHLHPCDGEDDRAETKTQWDHRLLRCSLETSCVRQHCSSALRSHHDFYKGGKNSDWIIRARELKYLIFVSGSFTESSHGKTLENQIGFGRPFLRSGDGWDGRIYPMTVYESRALVPLAL